MPQSYKVLGQSNPSATTLTTLYTVPSATQAACSTINVANLSSTAATFRVAVRPGGASIANQHYQHYDVSLPGNDSISLTLGWSLAATDVVSVYASTANVAFTLFGCEIT
jgi:hypothetical protein